jgi:hypothetical protein
MEKLIYAAQEINLDDNALRSLADQGLDTLVHLRCLRLRNNEFPSLDCLLEWLSLCHALKVFFPCAGVCDLLILPQSVYLEQSTTDGHTKLVESYIDVVGFRLRGVATIDDERNSHILEGMQLEAQRWLRTFDPRPEEQLTLKLRVSMECCKNRPEPVR